MSNARTVPTIYEAFGRGDVPTILGHWTDDVEWERGAADSHLRSPRQGWPERVQ